MEEEVKFDGEQKALDELQQHGDYIDSMMEGKPRWPVREIRGMKPFRVIPLGWSVEAKCHAEARKWVESELGLDPVAHDDLASNEGTVRILYEALRTADSDPAKPKESKRLATTLEKWRDFPLLTDLNLSLLWAEYLDVKLSCSMHFEALPESVQNEIIEGLKKNPTSTSPERMPRQWHLALLTSLATLLRDSTGSSSPTSTSSDSEDSSSTTT
jgi:hypothetical protein